MMGAGLLVVVGTVLAWASSAQAAGSITEYTDGLLGSSPERIVNGPDGNLWFTENEGNFGDSTPGIGKITPDGTVTTYRAGLGSDSSPFDITVGPEGNLWFTDKPVFGRGTPAIGRITPSGSIAEFTEAHDENGDPIGLSEPLNITPGPDGNLWFTDWAYVGGQPAIGRITPAGVITEYRLRTWSIPRSIVVGPDGNLWFTNRGRASGVQAIGKITPSGEITEYALPPNLSVESQTGPEIVDGPEGNLWFTDPIGLIGKITTGGVITEYTAGLEPESEPQEIVNGPDGNLWFTDQGGFGNVEGGEYNGHIGRITPSGSITEFGQHLNGGALTVGQDGNLWFGARGLGRITPSGQVTHFWLGLIEGGGANDVTVGPDGSNIWFTGSGFTEHGQRTGAIGKVAPVGPSGTSPLPTVEVDLEEGSGTGLVTSSPPGISCPGVCANRFAPGVEVTLTETAAPGSFLLFGSVAMVDDDPCPDPFPAGAVERPGVVCRFTVNGDALARVDFETSQAEEPAGGGETTPDGSDGGAANQGGGGSTSAPTTSRPGSVPAKSKSGRKPLKCRKGFKKRKVHGKAKCVKVKKKRHKR